VVRVIDMHNHLVAPEVVAFLEREGAHYNTRIVERDGQRFFVIQDTARRPLHARISQVEVRLSDMDAEGVDIQALSCVPFVMYPEVSAELGLTIARINNDALAAACARHPDRFVPLASVPLQDPPAAAVELERAAQLGLRGVEIPPNVLGQGLDEPQFEVFWKAAEALRMVVCIHPFEAAPRGMLARYGLGNLVENLVWSKFPNALCFIQLETSLGQVQPSRPAITVNVKQKLKQPIGDRFGIQPISKNTLVIGQREDGETCRRVVLLNSGLERFSAGIIAVCGEQDDLLTLTCLPHLTI
jgi:Amidohydrolase